MYVSVYDYRAWVGEGEGEGEGEGTTVHSTYHCLTHCVFLYSLLTVYYMQFTINIGIIVYPAY